MAQASSSRSAGVIVLYSADRVRTMWRTPSAVSVRRVSMRATYARRSARRQPATVASAAPFRRMEPVTSRFVRGLREALAAPGAPAAGTHVLVATSGGPDSSALLAGLVALAPAHGLTVTAGHVDHGLRGAESDADRAAVEALAARLGIACVVARAAVGQGANLEA